ncbi:RNA-binding cell elongation regulator Jag/EloR [Alicyclobacillus sp.]|uniref:RNA-binding cell elongation regulator Jag/EloR n=1 Tax=Alicyclobacillus sp. TaxID=61169 RepID=UPI0025BA904E|nr:RNA-binding cell elongation regulator Jag/EloR [Alicyclobacillus sp.]MCL6516002.1 protein jag [Alicyclobacillus sp.]
MKTVVTTGRTVEDAVQAALVRLGVPRERVEVRVLQEPVRPRFGFLGGRDAKVEVTVFPTPEERCQAFIEGVLQRMGVEARVEVSSAGGEDEPQISAQVRCAEGDAATVIGRRGNTLDALQYLVNVVVNQDRGDFLRVALDCGDYRRRRRESLEKMAERAASRAVRTKRPVSLAAMPASDRKVIHTHLQGRRDVITTSEGAEPHRKVVIVPVVSSEPRRSERRRGER